MIRLRARWVRFIRVAPPLISVFIALASPVIADNRASSDPRKRASDHPSAWQTAVVKIVVAASRIHDGRRKHFIEDCTGTIVGTPVPRLVTAWHCFADYNDLSNPPRFYFRGKWHPSRLIASGGSMQADWAILAFPESLVENVKLLSPGPAAPKTGSALTMAGFSGDAELGDNGDSLTFDSDCRVLDYDDHWGRTDCTAFKGASGGPVLSVVGGRLVLSGVVSAKDEQNRRLFTPIDRFIRALKRSALGAY